MTKKQTSLFPDEARKKDLTILRDLDRSEVEPLAFKILSEIEPFCEKAQIAGSIRRRQGKINDIDIVVQPKPDSWLKIIKTIRYEYDAITEKQGDKLATLYLPFISRTGKGHIQVDLYRASQSTWGILLLVRTGSAEHNVYLCNLALAKGLRLEYSRGVVDYNFPCLSGMGEVIAGKTEEEVFEALGLPFILPQDREVAK
jgi:DNA polymerase (family 10)